MSNRDVVQQVAEISERLGRIEERLAAIEGRLDGHDGLLAFRERATADAQAMRRQVEDVVEILGNLVAAAENASDARRANDLLRRARRRLSSQDERAA